jgi:uncharacterized protein (DUF1697 family)
VLFGARRASEGALERKAEAALQKELGRTFLTLVRPVAALRGVVDSDPYRAFRLPAQAKRVVTFLRERPQARPGLPIELDGARLLRLEDRLLFSAYLPGPRGPVFMTLIEKTFGKELTTRTWGTLCKLSAG